MRSRRWDPKKPFSCALCVVGLASPLVAQRPATPATGVTPSADTAAALIQAAATINAAGFAEYLTVLAADSMRGPTPSPALDRAAQYVAAQFHASGLLLLGSPNSGLPSYFTAGYTNGIQRYPIPGQFAVDYATSELTFSVTPHRGNAAVLTEAGHEVKSRGAPVDFATAGGTAVKAYVGSYMGLLREPSVSAVLLAGPQSLASVRQMDLQAKVVLYIPPAHEDATLTNAVLHEVAARSAGVVVVSSADSAQFAARRQASRARPPRLVDRYLPTASDAWVEVWPGDEIRKILDFAGVSLTDLRAAAAPITRPLPFLGIDQRWKGVPLADTVTAPNVMATVVGSDPELQKHYVVIAAHLGRRGQDAVDDGASVAGLLALAKAFRQPGAQPRRSLLFLVASGGDEAWGSHYFASRASQLSMAVTLNLGGQLTGASLAVDGLQEVDVPISPVWIAALHSELGLTVVDTGSVLTAASEQMAFAARWTPTLAFRAGRSSEPPPDSLHGTRDTTEAARYLQMIFYTVHALANDDRRPQWSSEGRRRLATQAP